ncbi:MAG: L,D-transpeptidase family protein [Planctomycetaceae bacterium]
MEPFAYQRPQSTNHRKLVLILLAGASFSIWYFDLVPHLAPVDTGRLDEGAATSDADFLAMLESPTVHSNALDTIVNVRPDAGSVPMSDEDPLLAGLTNQPEPIENSFPEFATASDAQTDKSNGSDVQQVGFETRTADRVTQALSESQPILSSEVAAELREADGLKTTGETLQAHAILSRLYWKHPELRTFMAERMEETSAEIYASPNIHFADPYVVEFGETLDGIALKFDVPWQYLGRLNSVTPETLQAGQQLKVLKGPFGAVIDLKRFEMTLHAHGWFVRRYTIGIGKDNGTPTGTFTVQNKLENPTWYDPNGGQVAGDDPTNPLGDYWLGLGDHIGIHGTIDPDSIGKAVSRGCIHLSDDDITEVFQLLGVGSEVRIRD